MNLGEVTLDHYGEGSNSKLQATSDIQTFGLMVTAEPYYAVTQPSDAVVLENSVRDDTRGVIESVNAHYDLLPRGAYTKLGQANGFAAVNVNKKNPFELYEAENAVQLARIAGADKYAADSFQQASGALDQAEQYEAQHPGQKPVITMAREAVVRAEDARVIALKREQQEAADNERAASLDRENASKARADQEKATADQAKVQAEASRMIAEREARERALADADRQAAEKAKADALAAVDQAKQERAAADAARQAAIAQQQQLAAETDRAHAEAAKAHQDALAADQMRQKAEADQNSASGPVAATVERHSADSRHCSRSDC